MEDRSAKRLKLAIVLPRFGEAVSGGAELLGRWLADRLSARGDHVEVFTTCATDHRFWRNDLEPGTEAMGDVRVHRFPVAHRDTHLFNELDGSMRRGNRLSEDLELLWLRNGVSSEEMEDELDRIGPDFDAVLSLPYLFGITYFAYETCPDNFVLIPCLHDEPAAHTSFANRMLTGARGVLFNSHAEAALANRLAGRVAPSAVVGVGIEPRGAGAASKRSRPPTLLYVGRREPDKNTPQLIDYFVRYKNRHPGELRLAFIGAGDPLPRRSDLIEIEADWTSDAMYRDADVFCQPSTNESFSIVLMQAWLAELPAVVHGDCAVTREHCERSNGGLWYRSYVEFEALLDRLLASPDLRGQLGRNGREYVEREYSWDAVLRRFDAALEEILTGSLRTGERVASQN